jgi:hypothetical protein
MSERSELSEVVAFVREHVDGMADSYARIGLRVTGIEAGPEGEDGFPVLLMYLEHEDVDGERVAWHSLNHNGMLQGPGDAAVTVAFGLLETTATEIARLPRSGRA